MGLQDERCSAILRDGGCQVPAANNCGTVLQMEPEPIKTPVTTMADDDNDKMSQFVTEDSLPICRICHCTNEDITSESDQSPTEQHSDQNGKKSLRKSKKNKVPSSFNVGDPFVLITPCYCTGSLRYVHHKCLQQWIRSSNHKYCELCKYNFKLRTKNKPLYKWQCFSMSGSERRKLVFHFSFNLVSMFCVFWSIYVIAERASAEINGRLGWRFWIKMLVVTVGFVCGIMFVFFQLKLYLSIFSRWKQYNQMIVIENVRKETNNLLLNHHQNTTRKSPPQLSNMISASPAEVVVVVGPMADAADDNMQPK